MSETRVHIRLVGAFLVFALCATVTVIAATATRAAAGTPDLGGATSIEFSGSSPFWDPDGDGIADPGDDIGTGPSNGFDGVRHYVRTGDRTSFKLEYNVNSEDADDLVLKASIIEVDAAGVPTGNPVADGVTFPELPPACQPGSGIAPDGHSVECNIGSVVAGTTAFVTLQVEADNSVPNGYRYAIVYEVCERAGDGSWEVQVPPIQSESVTTSSAPRYDLWKRRAHNRGPFPMPVGGPGTAGDVGVVIQYAVGMLGGDGDARGLSMLAEYDQDLNGNGSIDNVVTITDDISPIAGGAGPYGTPAGSYLFDFGNLGDGCGSNYGTNSRGELNMWGDQPRGQIGHDGGTIANATPDSGVWDCSQAGTTITTTITGADFRGQSFPSTTANGAGMSADQKWFASGWFAVWIPIEAIENGPDGVPDTADDGEYLSSDTLGTFDGNDIWGASNYGGGTEPTEDDADKGHRQNGLDFTLEEKGIGWDKEFRRSIPGYWSGVWNGWGNGPTNATGRDSGDGQAMGGTEFATYLTTINESFQSRTAFQQCDAIDNSTYQIAPDRNGFIWVGWMDGNSVDTTYPTPLTAWDSGWSGDPVDPDQHVVIEFGTGVNGGVAGNWADANHPVPSDPATWGGDDHWQRPAWNAMDDATCGDGDSADGWFELPNPYSAADLPAGVTLADITKFRVRINHPDADPAGTWEERSVLAAGQRINVAVHHAAYDNPILNNSNDPNDPYPTILANMAYDSYTNKNGTLFTRAIGYDPAGHTSIATGDRLIATKAQVRIDKNYIEKAPGSGPNFLGGDPVTWTLDPTVASLTDIAAAPANDVRVVDEFPQPYLEFVSGSASPATFTDLVSGAVYPVQFCIVAGCDKNDPTHWTTTEPADPLLVLGLMWDLGEVPLGATLPQLSYATYTAIDTPNNTDIPNVATIHSPSDNADEDRRSDETGIKVIQLGAFAVSKRVNTPIIFTDEIIEWELRFANVSAVDVDWYDLIDILPHNDQAAMADPLDFPSSYQGQLELLSITPAAGNVSHVLYYSLATPTAIVEDSSDASNALGAGSIWCSDDAAAVAGTPALGSAGCPAADLSDATAFRIVGDSLFGPPAPSGLQTFIVQAQTVGNDPIDFYANEYAVKLPDAVLTLPVKSNEVYTRVWGGSIGDLVFHDVNRDGVFNAGDLPMSGVDVTLIDVTNGNLVLDTATTDGDGRYVFDFIERPGDFKVQIDTANFAAAADPLFAYLVTTGAVADPDADRNENIDHDAFTALPVNGHESGVLTLGVGTEPAGEDVLSKDTSGAVDTDTNLTVDFGYYLPTLGLTIDKTVEDPANPGTFIESANFDAGDTVTYQIVVTNTGETDLEDVDVSDPNFAACDSTIGDLDAGDTVTYTCSGTITDQLDPNTATVTGSPTDGRDDLTDSDTASATENEIGIEKQVEDPDNPGTWVDAAEFPVGATVNFRIVVTNIGSEPITDAAISDPSYPTCDASSADLGISAGTPLGAGDSVTHTCSITATDGIVNTATVNATTASGATPSGSDSATVDTYGLTIDKTVYDPMTDADGTELGEYVVGETATFSFVVTNTGSVDLTDIALADDLYPACDQTIALLEAGDAQTITCDVVITDSGINTATVDGDTPDGNNPTDSDTAEVEARGLALLKQVWDPIAEIWTDSIDQIAGGEVTYQFTITNTGDVDISNIDVVDADIADCSSATLGETIPTLAPGESHVYQCEVIHDGGDFTNNATVTGQDPDGDPVDATGSASLTDQTVAIELVKEVWDPVTELWVDDTVDFAPGQTVTFRVTVTNTGTVDLYDVTVTDPAVTGCETVIDTLVAGASASIECDTTIGDDDIENTATVEAVPDCDQFYPTNVPSLSVLGDCTSVTATDDATASSNPASVDGTVTTPDGNGVSGVTVTITDDEGNVIGTATTDSDGEFSFEDLPPGDYTVSFAPPAGITLPDNYTPTTLTITGGETGSADQQAQLIPTLAFTGNNATAWAQIALLVALLGGAFLLVATRRRQEAEAHT